jgi:hypothetical protein
LAPVVVSTQKSVYVKNQKRLATNVMQKRNKELRQQRPEHTATSKHV